MAEAGDNKKKDRVSEAMDEVLEAEHQAQQDIEAAREEAKRIVQDARTRAQEIEDRADARISRVHRDYQADTQAAVDEILSSRQNNQDVIEQPGDDLIDTAVARVAARLSGGNNDVAS